MQNVKPRFTRNRQAILEAARVIIVQKGIEGLSMRLLAEKADYSPSTLYRYFEDKEAILDALAKDAAQTSLTLPSKRKVSNDDPLDALLQSGLRLYDFARSHPVEYQLMTSATRSSPKSLDSFLKDQNFEGLLVLIEEGQSSGTLQLPQGFNAELMALLLWFTIHGASMLRTGLMKEYGEECDQMVEQLAAGLKKMMKTEYIFGES
jgi:AcrR family transcriptional regulator